MSSKKIVETARNILCFVRQKMHYSSFGHIKKTTFQSGQNCVETKLYTFFKNAVRFDKKISQIQSVLGLNSNEKVEASRL